MDRPMKNITILHLFSLLYTCSALAAVPLSWTVETTRAQPATFEAAQHWLWQRLRQGEQQLCEIYTTLSAVMRM